VKSEWEPSQEDFDRFLAWLDTDRERAGEKYEQIRRKLVMILANRGCTIADELADETVNRVIRKIPEIAATYSGDQRLYFYGVAKRVLMEHWNRRDPQPPPAPDPAENTEVLYDCLERCLDELDAESRLIIREYFSQEKREKIDTRKGLAERFGITPNTLRMRVHRIKAILFDCIVECSRRSEAS